MVGRILSKVPACSLRFMFCSYPEQSDPKKRAKKAHSKIGRSIQILGLLDKHVFGKMFEHTFFLSLLECSRFILVQQFEAFYQCRKLNELVLLYAPRCKQMPE